MSSSVVEFIDGVDGVRGGVAEAVGSQFATVAELSQAKADRLTSVKGVGPVLAERILDAARTAVVADHTPDSEPTPDPATRAKASVAQARSASRPALDVIEGGAEEVADGTAMTSRSRPRPATTTPTSPRSSNGWPRWSAPPSAGASASTAR